MSTGPDNVTTTQTTSPPGFLIPGITSATNAALSQSGLGGFQQPQLTQPLSRRDLKRQKKLRKQSNKLGIPFTPNLGGSQAFDPGSILGGPRNTNFSNGVPNPSVSPDPAAGLLDQSAGLVSDTLSGDFLDPSTNPFLESTFSRAADLTRTRLSSEFAGAGRNLDASQPARSNELQTLAAGIFGPNFQAERDRQVGAVGQAQGLDPLNQLINRLAGITPGAGGVTTSQQPVFNNTAGNILGGGLGLLSLI